MGRRACRGEPNPTRVAVFEYVADHPGARFNAIKRGLGLSNGSLQYHLNVLIRSGRVRAELDGGRRAFYPALYEGAARSSGGDRDYLFNEVRRRYASLSRKERAILDDLLLGGEPRTLADLARTHAIRYPRHVKPFLRRIAQKTGLAIDLTPVRGEAGCALAQAEGDPLRSPAAYMEALALLSDSTDRSYREGRSLLRKGRFEEAVALFQRAVEMNPMDADAYCGIGEAWEGLGRSDLAIAAYEKAVALAPREPLFLNNLAVALASRGRLLEARSVYLRAVEVRDWDGVLWQNLAEVEVRLGRRADALDHLSRAVKCNPEDASAWFDYASVAESLGQRAKAAEGYDRVTALEPNHVRAWSALGSLAFERGDVAGALRAFREVVRCDPSDTDAWFNLGMLLSTYEGDDAGAMEAFSEVISQDKDDGDAWFKLGVVLERQGHADAAIRAYREAVRVNGSDAEAWLRLGALLMDAEGRAEEAAGAFRRAADAAPDDPKPWAGLASALAACGDARGARDAAERSRLLASRVGRPGDAGAARVPRPIGRRG